MSFVLKYTMTTTFKYLPEVIKKRQDSKTLVYLLKYKKGFTFVKTGKD